MVFAVSAPFDLLALEILEVVNATVKLSPHVLETARRD
jgi:hypothetical protein